MDRKFLISLIVVIILVNLGNIVYGGVVVGPGCRDNNLCESDEGPTCTDCINGLEISVSMNKLNYTDTDSFQVSYSFNPSTNVCSKYLISPSGRKKLIESNINCQSHINTYSSSTIVDFFNRYGLAPETGKWGIEVLANKTGYTDGFAKTEFEFSSSKNFPPIINYPKLSVYKIEERKNVNIEAEVVDDKNIKNVVALVKHSNGTLTSDSPFIMSKDYGDKYSGVIVAPSVPSGYSINFDVYVEATDSDDEKRESFSMVLNVYSSVSGGSGIAACGCRNNNLCESDECSTCPDCLTKSSNATTIVTPQVPINATNVSTNISQPIPIESDKCKTNEDCNDNKACTVDICSGSPKTCSYVQINGCELNGNCVAQGTRANISNTLSYCGLTNGWEIQKADNEICQNNYECISNFCSEGKCLSIEKEIRTIKAILQQIIDFIKGIFKLK